MDLFKIRGHRDSPHVDLVESGEHGAGVLSLLQPLGDPQPHTVHLHLGGGNASAAQRLSSKT